MVSCTVCGVTVAASYLNSHMAKIYGICVPQTRGVDEVGVGMATYAVFFPRVLQEVKCPMPGCPSVAYSAGRLHEHFMHCHFRSKVAVVQEGTYPLTRCDLCRTHMPEWRLISHRKTARYYKKHSDEVEEAGCGNCGQVCGSNVQPNRGG